MKSATPDLRRTALDIFSYALRAVDARRAMHRALDQRGDRLHILDRSFGIGARPIYAIALGKAAGAMAAALDDVLGEKLQSGVASVSDAALPLSPRWHVFFGGHPLPNEASLAAGRCALSLLHRANRERALVIFLVSGGGSAMMEWPRSDDISLDELRATNEILVSCGATIAEINAVRRAFSAIKGGGLSAAAPRAEQATLIVSDTNPGEEFNVASGPTLPPPDDAPDPRHVIAKYDLVKKLPPSVLLTIENFRPKRQPRLLHHSFVLLENADALRAAEERARGMGFNTTLAADIVEQEISQGCAQLVQRLLEATTLPFCLLSGGEFSCAVRGAGKGGRNAETALRCALELAARGVASSADATPRMLVLAAGTDGIDGNSPAAGAIADDATLARAREAGLDAARFLAGSDSYTFFHLLGDAIITGPTGTNVRDVRVLLRS